MSNGQDNRCGICNTNAFVQEKAECVITNCERCGKYKLTIEAYHDLRNLIANSNKKQAILSYSVRQASKALRPPILNYEFLSNSLKTQSLPNAAEQADNLIQYLGNNQDAPEEYYDTSPLAVSAEIGALSPQGAHFIINHLRERGLVSSQKEFGNRSGGKPIGGLMLTFAGWQEYESLKARPQEGNHAFMAMAFSNQALAEIVDSHLKPEITKAGFNLMRVDDDQSSGLIDDKIRTWIRISHFVICDLTDRNNGAYWEAGFAEGLDRPVFYTCEESAFQGGAPHFDTAHQTIIRWTVDEPAEFADDLKAAIRATLPDKAKLQDD